MAVVEGCVAKWIRRDVMSRHASDRKGKGDVFGDSASTKVPLSHLQSQTS